MFMFKTMGNLIFGDDPSTNLKNMKIKSGEFFVLPPVDASSSAEVIQLYNDAELYIRSTNYEFQYELVVSRIFEEGELESELVKSDEKLRFNLNKEPTNMGDAQVFSWYYEDLRKYEYVTLETTAGDSLSRMFSDSVVGCAYERKRGISRANATYNDIKSLSELMSKANLNPVIDLTEEPEPKAQSNQPKPKNVVLEVNANLYLFDVSRDCYYATNFDTKAYISKEDGNWLSVFPLVEQKDVQGPIVHHLIQADMTPFFSNNTNSFAWNHKEDIEQTSWLLKFDDPNSEIEFKTCFIKALHESQTQIPYEKLTASEQDYTNRNFDYDLGEERGAESEDIKEESDDEVVEVSSEPATKPFNPTGDDVNSQLNVGYKHNRSFVTRGSKIGVFRHTDDNGLEHAATIDKLIDSSGKIIKPHKSMLYEQDSSMILLDPKDTNSIIKLDLTTGKIAEKYKVHDIIPVSNVFGSSKYASLTTEKTLVGISHNALYRIDPRVNGPTKLVESELKQSFTKTNFTCAVTTVNGEIAVANEKGEVRLYDRLGIKAKTALPALGEPIYSLDVSNDGQYIIATCKSFLVLINTLITSDPQHRTGFNKSFPKEEKPKPLRLLLKPADVAKMGHSVHFTPAHFNAGEGNLEKYIITSTGPYVVMWNFRKVKANDPFAYSLRKLDDQVVAGNFQFNKDRSVVAIMPNNIALTSKNEFQSANQALRQPASGSNLRSKSNAVRTYK